MNDIIRIKGEKLVTTKYRGDSFLGNESKELNSVITLVNQGGRFRYERFVYLFYKNI